MSTFETLPANEVIELYYAKHAAINSGDMVKLIDLKRQYPDLFTKTADAQIKDMINYAKAFEKTDRYKQLRRQELRSKLSLIINEDNLVTV